MASANVLPPSLRLLLRLQVRGDFRRLWKMIKTPVGILMLLWFSAIVCAMVIGGIAMAVVYGATLRPSDIRAGLSLLLLALFMLQVYADYSVAFSPAEVNTLFPAPFLRRQLLAQRLALGSVSSALLAFFGAISLAGWLGFLRVFVAVFLAVMYILAVGMVLWLIDRKVPRRWPLAPSRAVLLLILFALAMGAWTAINPRGLLRAGTLELLQGFWNSTPVQAALAPFMPFAFIATAPGPLGALGWTAVALVLDAVLIAGVLRLNMNFYEEAAVGAEKRYKRMERLQKGGILALSGPTRPLKRSGLLHLPWLAGAGPLFQRQLAYARRRGKGFVIAAALLVVAAAVICHIAGGGSAEGTFTVQLGVLFYLAMFLPNLLPFDFRGDFHHLPLLKTLPIRPLALTMGQVATPVIYSTALYWAVIAVIAVFTRDWGNALATAAVMVCFNFMVYGIENLFFLLYPAPLQASPTAFNRVGRQVLFGMLKLLVLFGALAIAGVPGLLVYDLLTPSPWAWGTIVSIPLAAEAAVVLWIASRLFEKIDCATIFDIDATA